MSVALNPFNNLQREYDNRIDEYPAVLGADIAGVVEKVGEAVQGFRPSVRTYSCWFHVGWDVDIDTVDFRFAGVIGGGFQQYVALPAAVIIRVSLTSNTDRCTPV